MDKRLKQYGAYLDAAESLPLTPAQLAALRADALAQIGFFAHERLVHLLVTLGFALFTLLSLFAMAVTGLPAFGALTALSGVLLVPYIWHYYKLENGVQALYPRYDRIERRLSGQGFSEK